MNSKIHHIEGKYMDYAPSKSRKNLFKRFDETK